MCMHLEHFFFRMWTFKWRFCWSFTLRSFSRRRNCSLSLNFIAHNMCHISNGHFPKQIKTTYLNVLLGMSLLVTVFWLTNHIHWNESSQLLSRATTFSVQMVRCLNTSRTRPHGERIIRIKVIQWMLLYTRRREKDCISIWFFDTLTHFQT